MSDIDPSTLSPYAVEPTDPRVLHDLVPVDLPDRHPALPPLFRYTTGRHPQLPVSNKGSCYVYLVDTSPDARTAFRKMAASMRVACGMINESGGNADLRGLLQLNEGDTVFSRDIDAGGDPMEDALQVLVATLDSDSSALDKRTALVKSRDVILGPRDTRDSRRVWFEEQGRAKEISNGARCYGLSNMFERAHNSTAPPAALKVVEGRLDAVQLAVKEMVRSSTDYNMTMWSRMAPESLQKVLEAYAELINAPRIGCEDNYMWSSCQLNVAEPQRVSAEQSLGATNGKFGECHIDALDTPTHLSCATVLSDLPEEPGWEPGRMHFLGIGCYIVLTPFKQFFFTGLQKHGSTRPLVPAGHPIPRWACRVMMICYPNQAITLGTVKRCFSVEPGKPEVPVYLTPHMFAGPHGNAENGHYTSHATMAQDGVTVMDDSGLVNFHGRSNLTCAHWNMSLLPPHLKVQIDAEKFLDAFTYLNHKNERVHLKPWSLAPASDVGDPYTDRHVEVQNNTLHTLYDRMAKGIPELGSNPFKHDYLTNRGVMTRPASFRPATRRLDPLPPHDEYFAAPLSPPKRRKSTRKTGKTPGGSKDTDDTSDPGVAVGVSRKRKRATFSSDDEQRYDLRQSVRRDIDESGSTPPLSPPAISELRHAASANVDLNQDVSDSDQSDDEPLSQTYTRHRTLRSMPSLPLISARLGDTAPTQSSSALHSGEIFDFNRTLELVPAQQSTYGVSRDQLLESPELTLDRQTHPRQGEDDMDQSHRLDRLHAWCNEINTSALQKILDSVVFATRHIPSMRFDTLCWSTSTLDRFETVVEPFRMGPEDLSKYLSVFSVAKHQSINTGVWSGILRQRIILHEHRLARSVVDVEEVLCPEIFARGTFLQSPQNWIEYLLRDIRIKLVIRYKDSISLSSHSYLKSYGLPNVIYTEPDWVRKDRMWTGTRPSNEDFSRRAAVYLGRVLRTWFDLPNGYLTRGRAHLVDVLVSKFGPGVLYLSTVWDLHHNLPRQLYRNPPWDYNTNQLDKDKPYDPSSMVDFIELVQAIPDKVSKACGVLERAHSSFLRLVQAYVRQVEGARSGVAPVSPSPCGVYDRRLNLIQMIVDTAAVLRHLDGDELLTDVNEARRAILDAPDARICAREYAPSRRLMSHNVDKAFMRTREGFFTALIFRNILFNSESFLSCPAWIAKYKFVTLADWDDYMAQLKKYFHQESDDFFCNPRALGQPIAERTVEQAPHFKYVSEVCDWPDSWPVTFAEMYGRLREIKNAIKLPGCGSLGLYLLCADMVHYDMVEMPSVDDMAHVVLGLRMGALSGLEILGYLGLQSVHGVTGSDYTVDQVKEALVRFSCDTRLMLMATGQEELPLDMIDVEHVLCKFSRMWNNKLYQSS